MSKRPTVVLYDGICPACTQIAERLRRLDNNRGRLELVDLRQDNRHIRDHNLRPAEVRRVMHAITPDGTVHTAMDAVRVAMRAVGRGWLVAWTRLPLLSHLCDRIYLWFANNRLRFFGAKPR